MRAAPCCNGDPSARTSMLNRWAPYWALPLRLILGGSLIAHGVAKFQDIAGTAGFFGSVGIPAPGAMAWVVALLEVGGGLLLIAGALTAVVTSLLIANMLVAMFTVHWENGFFFTNQPPGVEVNVLFIAGLLALLLGGPGPLSVDRRTHPDGGTAP